MTAATSDGAHARAVTAEDPPPDVARPSGWAALRARLPAEETAGLVVLALLVGLGVAVALDWTTATTAVALAVVVLGARILVDARRGELPAGVAVVGGLLVLVLAACWWSGTSLDHAPGWRTERPEVGLASYDMAAGSLTIDLTESPRPVGVDAKVGVGRVIVKVPDADIKAGRVLVLAKVAGGWASVPVPRFDAVRPIGRDAGPVLMDEVATRPAAGAPIVVRVQVGVGNVEVHRVR